LKPNQPKKRMIVPNTPIGILWPGIAFADPSLLKRPMRGPRTTLLPEQRCRRPCEPHPNLQNQSCALPKPNVRPRFWSQPLP
jgi:hypothetical protein